MSDPAYARMAWRHAATLLLTAGITFVYSRIISVNTTTVALTFLLAILGIAAGWGLSEAILASIAGMLCFNFFFLPPIGTLTIADPQNWVALSAFLVTAIVASQLSASARRRAIEATRNEREMERLYELSRSLMLVDNQSSAASQMSYWIVQVFKVPGVAIFDRDTGEVYRAGDREIPFSDGRLHDIAIQNTALRDPGMNISVLPLRFGGEAIGSLAIMGADISDPALQAVANVIAIARGRARSCELAARVEAARQNEVMKAALMDALAHEFTQPLLSIKIAAASVLDVTPRHQKELVSVIEEETDRLSSLVRQTLRKAGTAEVVSEIVLALPSYEKVHS